MSTSSLPNNNPVDRLRKILTDAAKADPLQNIPTIICQSLNLPNTDVNFVTGISHIIQLTEHIEKHIEKYFPDDKDEYSKALKEIRLAIAPVIKIAYADQKYWRDARYLNNTDWWIFSVLSLCSKAFMREKIFLEIEELETVSNDIEELINYIINSSLNEDFKNNLLTRFKEIKSILDNFYNYDIKDLKDEVTLTSLDIYNLQNENQDNFSEQQRQDLSNISQKTLDIFRKITRHGAPIFLATATVIGLLNDSITLPDNLQKLRKNPDKAVIQQAELETPRLPPSK